MNGEKVKCAHCDGTGILKTGLEIYPRFKYLHKKFYWQCNKCGAYVGTHIHSKSHKPLGTMANQELRNLRFKVHAKLNIYWRVKGMRRSIVYKFFAKSMNIPVNDCHVDMFGVKECNNALRILHRSV